MSPLCTIVIGTVVIDNEAGMEHLSRRSAQSLDYLLIVSDLTAAGLKDAKRINILSAELNIVYKTKRAYSESFG